MKRILALFLATVLALSFSAFSVFAEENSGTMNDSDSSQSNLEYTLNVKTKKIHVPTCSSAIKTAEENKETYFG
jgi:peptidoglycan hydrolase CwlO-like protein